MPQDRLRSPRAGHGRRTSALTDFEYRVWDQYQLSSDDFGVMRCSALTIQNDNDALANRLMSDVQQALERLISVGLVLRFEHQERAYICQSDWQTFQKIEYPRVTLLPKPSAEVLEQCDLTTRQLFRKHPGGTKNGFQKTSKCSPKVSRTSAEGSPTSRARDARETANGLRLTQTANGQLLEASGSERTATQQFDETFWPGYPNKDKKQEARKAYERLKATEALLVQIMAGVEKKKRTPGWQKDNGQYIPHASTFLNQRRWEDEGVQIRGSTKDPNSPIPDVDETKLNFQKLRSEQA